MCYNNLYVHVGQGYWWQPVCRDGVHRLLYEEVDESKVLIVQFMSHDQSSPEEFRLVHFTKACHTYLLH